MFSGDRRYDVMYYDDELDTDILWLRTPYFIEMIRAVIFLMSDCKSVTVRIRDVGRYARNQWRK